MPKDKYEAGLLAAKRAVLRKLPIKKASSINGLAEMAGMDAADIYQCAAEECQQEMETRINMLLARRAKPLKDVPFGPNHQS